MIKKLSLTSLLLVFSIATLMAQASGIKSISGRTMRGKNAEGRNVYFRLSQDGKTLTYNGNYSHNFFKEINGVFVFEGKFRGKPHYDAIKIIDEKTLLISFPQAKGPIDKFDSQYTDAESVAKNIEKDGLYFSIRENKGHHH
ncbi:MAG: hypothetical protein ACRCVN_02770 [Spirochaetia bacterium]